MKYIVKLIFGLIGFLFIVISMSCSEWGMSQEDLYKKKSPKEIMEQADKALTNKQFESASKDLEALQGIYPFNEYSEKAEKNLLYAYYQKGDYPAAVAVAQRFIHLYPRSSYIDYVYYMKGMANFRQTRGVFATILPLDESWRDPGTQTEAYEDFSTLVKLFPTSKYVPDAIQHMIYLRNMLAKRELHNAEYYFKRKKYIAVLQHTQYLLKHYPQSPEIREALVMSYQANQVLGLDKAAEEIANIYQATFKKEIA